MIICVNDKSPLFLHSYFLYFVLCLWYRPSEPVWCDMNRVDLFPCHRYERRQILIFWLSLNNKVLLYLFLLLPGFLHAGYRQTVNINFTAVDVPFSLMAYEDTHVKYPPRTFFTQTRLSSLAKVWCWLWQRWILLGGGGEGEGEIFYDWNQREVCRSLAFRQVKVYLSAAIT